MGYPTVNTGCLLEEYDIDSVNITFWKLMPCEADIRCSSVNSNVTFLSGRGKKIRQL